MPVRVKICGITTLGDALAAVEAGADLLGFNFWPGSSRHVTAEGVEPILAQLPERVLAVGVFVNAPREEIERLLARLRLGAIQLHGDESPEDCDGYRVPVIKALAAVASADLAALAGRYPADYILLDSGAGGRYGGTGERFPWERAAGVAPGRLFLAGGLTPANVAEAVRRVRPYAVDVAGGVESAPGVKDAAKMKELVNHVRLA